jgi:endonuclease III related protein
VAHGKVPLRAIVCPSVPQKRRQRKRITGRSLLRVYERLAARFGPAGWWPGESPFEVCLGAILTQNTSWANAEKALDAMRAQGRLSYAGLRSLPVSRLAALIRSSGTFNVKARRIAAFLAFLGSEFGGSVDAMRDAEPAELRSKLLSVHGIGRETADSIALYAAGRPLFVVDGYTRRVFARLGLLQGDEAYDDIQQIFMGRLPKDAALFNDYHAQIVRLAKDVCRPRPRCGECPLEDLCPKLGVPAKGAGHAAPRGSTI